MVVGVSVSVALCVCVSTSVCQCWSAWVFLPVVPPPHNICTQPLSHDWTYDPLLLPWLMYDLLLLPWLMYDPLLLPWYVSPRPE